MSNNNNHQLGEAPWLHVVISTGFGVGFWPWGSGTLGGFVALLIWIALYFTLSPLWLAVATVLLVLTTLLVGVWTDNVMERYWGEDPRTVIIDEYFGTWVATLAALFVDGPSYVAISLATIGFVLFRIIDITKPLGCRWVDRHIHGGWGCMLDDALAGFYALCLTLIIRYACLVESVHDLLS
ncbi:phosphatidylglycerophosphatase A family protein [Leyella stercorea]|uniref:phosphatidylglycerophosphatase A family protein n=1 Tax=Leyella stercorea TaxID=363265 RepID=UPI00242B22EF|nr:phosphatidylglycerophosphatase A [Leyella stercorea]